MGGENRVVEKMKSVFDDMSIENSCFFNKEEYKQVAKKRFGKIEVQLFQTWPYPSAQGTALPRAHGTHTAFHSL